MAEWTTITDDVKTRIIRYLDYGSRCSMRSCSKKDKDSVDKTAFKAQRISICEWFSEMASYKTLIRIDIDSFTIWFIGRENKTRIDRGWNDELYTDYCEVKEGNRHDFVREYLEKYFKKFGIIETNVFRLVMFTQPPSPNWKIKCDELSLYNVGISDEQWIIQNISEKFRKLEISRNHGSEFRIDERILNTSSSLRLNLDSNMPDEHLETIRAMNFHVKSELITWNGVKRFLERFLRNSSKEDELEITIPLPRDFDFRKMIPDGVIYRKLKISDRSSSIFRAKISSGFNNINGANDERILRVRFTPERAEITCEIPKERMIPCELDPIKRQDDSD